MTTVVTHDGVFHADDVFGAAVLGMVFGDDLIIVRTRNADALASAAIRFDVGGASNGATDFDHHQRGGAGVRPNGVPFASFGLLWQVYGAHVCGSTAVAVEVDRGFVCAIDAHDNGYKLSTPTSDVPNVAVSHLVSNFNPSWDEGQDFDAFFYQALGFADGVLRRAIARARGVVDAKQIVRDAVRAANDPRIVVLDRFLPWQEALIEASDEALFVVYPSAGTWRVQVVPIAPGQPGARKPLPEAWAGLDGAELDALTGVSDATFAHRGRFIAGAQSEAGALALARIALS